MSEENNKIRCIILEKLNRSKSITPREIAIAITDQSDNWQRKLPKIKQLAIQLESENLLTFLRKGKPIGSSGLKGVYRLAKPQSEQASKT
jgi:hypothetical protein